MSSERTRPQRISIEGLTPNEILALPDEHLAALIAVGPIVFKVGTATVLGQVSQESENLTVELAQIDGGGEGVLLTLSTLAEAFARRHGLRTVEWVVHAVNCAAPNLKLRRVLQKRGFVVKELSGIGAAYFYRQDLGERTDSARSR